MNTTPKVVLSTDNTFDVSAWENSTLAAGDGGRPAATDSAKREVLPIRHGSRHVFGNG